MTDITPPAAGSALACASPRPSRRTSRTAFVADPPDPDDPLLGFEPYVHVAPRRNSITPDRQRAFIAALAASGVVTQAAREIGASLEALYKLRHRKGAEGFSAAWEMALDRGMARLEDCALERAIQGEERVFLNRAGEVVARWTRYDTALITFLLRQRRSDRFGAGGSFASLRPGHPVYDRLKKEWQRERALEDTRNSAEIIASIDRKFALMRQRRIAAGQMKPSPNEPGEMEAFRRGEEERRKWREEDAAPGASDG
jgi:hypothetical protein